MPFALPHCVPLAPPPAGGKMGASFTTVTMWIMGLFMGAMWCAKGCIMWGIMWDMTLF
jgi:hypothetical protein